MEFRRDHLVSRKVEGRIVLPEGATANFADVAIEVGSNDGDTNEKFSLKADSTGNFSFDTKSTAFGIVAGTAEDELLGIAQFDKPDAKIEIVLKPTGTIRGQLLGFEDKPIEGHRVRLFLRTEGPDRDTSTFSTYFEARRLNALTDANGNYELTGVPLETPFVVWADKLEGDPNTASTAHAFRFFLTPGDEGPRLVSKLWTNPDAAANVSLEQQYQRRLRDCALSDYHLLVISFRPDDATKMFVDNHLLDYDQTAEVSRFMQLTHHAGESESDRAETELQQRNKDFVALRNWPEPEPGIVVAVAIDAAGNELGRIELVATEKSGQSKAADFVREHAPQTIDAQEKWDSAFELARQTNRRVWVRFSGRYCGPCFSLTRWLDDQKAILEQDFVLLKIDLTNDLNATEIADRIRQGRQGGIPFHGILAADETLIADSFSPAGNIGFPASFDGQKFLRGMLDQSKINLTDEQIDQIIESLEKTVE